MTGDYSLAALSVPESLNLLHDLLERVGQEHPDLAEQDLMLFETAVIEIVGNVVEHGRPTGKVSWQFELTVDPDRLAGLLTDSGEHYEHDLAAVMPDLLDESGRGMALARAAVDELTYQRVGPLNQWTMVRRRQA